MRSSRRTGPGRLLGQVVATAALVVGCAPGPSGGSAPPSAAGSGVSVVTDDALPRLALSRFLPGAPGWPDRMADAVSTSVGDAPAPDVDHGIALGGVGSDLYPAGSPDEYWMITDRGPNGQIKVKGPNRRTFPVPAFDPLLLRVQASSGAPLRILQVIPLTTADGRPVTGLPNDAARDEQPYDLTGTNPLPTNPSGLDTEGMVRAPNGEFWLSEEYSPSIVRVSPTGTVVARFVPRGLTLPGAGYPVTDSLPPVLARRQDNRGFESLAISPDGRTLYTAVQSPLSNPDQDTGQKSRVVRILALDTSTGQSTAEYVYRMEDVLDFDPAARGDQSEMKISALT